MTRKPTNQTHSRIFTSSPSLSHSNVWWLLHHSTTETSLAFCAVIRSSDVNNAVYCVAVTYSSFTKRHVVKHAVSVNDSEPVIVTCHCLQLKKDSLVFLTVSGISIPRLWNLWWQTDSKYFKNFRHLLLLHFDEIE